MPGSRSPGHWASRILGCTMVASGGKRYEIQERSAYDRTARVVRTVTIIPSSLESQYF